MASLSLFLFLTHTHTLSLSLSLLYFSLSIRYLESLVDYLTGYLERVQPLVDQTELLLEIKKDFEEKWGQGTFPGWKVSSTLPLKNILILFFL